MNNDHAVRNLLLTVAGLVIVGAVAWWVITALLGLIFYAIVGAAVVGGGIYLYRKSRRSIGS